MELSQFQDPSESKTMLREAVEKLEEALVINPSKHEAMWCLGNALTTHAFLISDLKEATPYFQKAADYFDQAARQDPSNELYIKSLEVSAKALELHGEIPKGSFCQSQVRVGASSSNASEPKISTEKKEPSDGKYEIMGWVIVAVGIVVAWLGYKKNRVQTKPLPK